MKVALLLVVIAQADAFLEHFSTRSSRLPLRNLLRRTLAPDGGSSDSTTATAATNQLERFFFDQCDVFVKSGKGGKGALSSIGNRPAGGDGGAGGAVIIQAAHGLSTLIHIPGKKYAGADGADAKQRETGANGADCIIIVPPNCVITRKDTNETLATLKEPGERLVVCRGGEGGRGNGASGKPDKVSPPTGGKKDWLSLQMTLVADVGLIGFPNAGKV